VAKTINFGICYGMSSSGLAETSNIAPKEAHSFISAYYRTYPRVKNTLDQLGLKALSSGYAETPLGRKRYFKPPGTYGEQKSIERMGRNTPIQATCADILKKAISHLMGSLEDLDAKIINLVHDEIVIECHQDTVNQVMDIVKSDMVRAGEAFIKSVPVEVDVTVDNMWRKK
jgi:DNA polymerase-1